ncbi:MULTISPECIES: GntR family transcriptional regulator [unclassified Streptomyces]|uniref:FadR/GntR family transcriptional regulator n=1 Tax=unclassified Streptomyces TaxID=2593676 RepID=UPI001EF17197|nr:MULTISPECIES: GntR family transcriptional regulator [unclassified Streptomyces]
MFDDSGCPPEADLCEELGVSHGSPREAVRKLAALGVVEPRHGSGTYVSPPRPEDLIGSLSLTPQLRPLPGLVELYEIRRVLEVNVAAQADAHAGAAGATKPPAMTPPCPHPLRARGPEDSRTYGLPEPCGRPAPTSTARSPTPTWTGTPLRHRGVGIRIGDAHATARPARGTPGVPSTSG